MTELAKLIRSGRGPEMNAKQSSLRLAVLGIEVAVIPAGESTELEARRLAEEINRRFASFVAHAALPVWHAVPACPKCGGENGEWDLHPANPVTFNCRDCGFKSDPKFAQWFAFGR